MTVRAGVHDNTLVIYIAGDNGMSAEGGLAGTLNELAPFNGAPDTTQISSRISTILAVRTVFPHIPVGWALAGDTPSNGPSRWPRIYGGTRNGMVISWPAGIKDANGIRTQWHHVVDITPTIPGSGKTAAAENSRRHQTENRWKG